jgi:sterol 14-demethylase
MDSIQQRSRELLLPPALPGIPLLGNLLAFQKDASGMLLEGFKKFGPIFSIKFGPKRIAVLIGKENNDFFFSMTDKLLSLREVYQWMIPVFGGDDYTLAAPREKYLEQRKVSLAFFRSERVPYYFSSMVSEATDWVEKLGAHGEFELCSTFGVLLMHIASRAFVGAQFRQYMGDEFREQFGLLAAGVDYLLPPNLPLPRFYRRNMARKKMLAMITQFINQRKAQGFSGDDTLQFMMDFRDDTGKPLSDEAAAGIILKLIFAGHETTQSQLSWGLIQLLQNPEYITKILEEQTNVLNDNMSLAIDKIKKLERLEWALKETERMRPIALALLRHNSETYERSGYQIPKGWLTMISPFVSHRLPEIYPNPEKYDPDRFSPERDIKHNAMNSLCGFGGGSHKCLGINFAYMNMSVILTLLLQHYELELVTLNPQPKKGMVSQPQSPCIVRYMRR